MKYIFLLAVIALGSATTLYGAQKEVRVDNDRIVVRTPGKIVVIEKQQDDAIMVFVKEHNHFIRKIIIDKDCQIVKEVKVSIENELPEKFSSEEESKETTSSEEQGGRIRRCGETQGEKTQMEYLVEIFKKYEGVVREDRFKDLLDDLKVLVDNKQCHPVILEFLKELEDQTTEHTSKFHFWRLHWNMNEPLRSLWGRKNMNQEKTEDQQKQTKFFGTERENQFNQEHVDRQHDWIQDNIKDHQQELEDTLRTTTDSFGFFKDSDCSKDAMAKQLVYQNNIREIQNQIYHHQLRAQQLQLQQQFLNQQKHKTKLQIMTGHQQGMTFVQVQELTRVRQELQQKEMDLLETQKNLHLTINKLHQELTKQEQRLQRCLEEERREDDKTMGKMF